MHFPPLYVGYMLIHFHFIGSVWNPFAEPKTTHTSVTSGWKSSKLYSTAIHMQSVSCIHLLLSVLTFMTVKHPLQIKGRKCVKTWHYESWCFYFYLVWAYVSSLSAWTCLTPPPTWRLASAVWGADNWGVFQSFVRSKTKNVKKGLRTKKQNRFSIRSSKNIFFQGRLWKVYF